MIIGFIKSKFQYIWHGLLYDYLHLPKPKVAPIFGEQKWGVGFSGDWRSIVGRCFHRFWMRLWSADDFFVETTKLKVLLNDPPFFMTFSSVKRQAMVARWSTNSRPILEESYNLKPVEPRLLIGCQCWIVFRYGKRGKKIKWNSDNMYKSKKKKQLFL